MYVTSLNALRTVGHSTWVDSIWCNLILKGQLRYLIKKADLQGMTSNPTILPTGSHEAPETLLMEDLRNERDGMRRKPSVKGMTQCCGR